MTPREKIQKLQELVRKISDNTDKIDLVNADLVFINRQFNEWNKLNHVTIEQTELGKRYIGKILMNIKEAKKLGDDGMKLMKEAKEYSFNNKVYNDKIDKIILLTPKIDWDLYFKTYTDIYNEVDKAIKEYKKIDNEGDEWKE